MTELLRQIELLYHALEHDESAWATFLDSECAGDEGLRLEVDSLLSYSKSSENFFEKSPLSRSWRKSWLQGLTSELSRQSGLAAITDAAIKRLKDEVDRRLDSRPP